MHNTTEREALATIACAGVVASLTPRQREVLALTAVCGLTQQEAAGVLGVSQPAVAMRLRRARQRAAARCR